MKLEILLPFMAGAKVAMIALTLDRGGQNEVLDLMTVTCPTHSPIATRLLALRPLSAALALRFGLEITNKEQPTGNLIRHFTKSDPRPIRRPKASFPVLSSWLAT
jgi:hypothetical protein